MNCYVCNEEIKVGYVHTRRGDAHYKCHVNASLDYDLYPISKTTVKEARKFLKRYVDSFENPSNIPTWLLDFQDSIKEF